MRVSDKRQAAADTERVESGGAVVAVVAEAASVAFFAGLLPVLLLALRPDLVLHLLDPDHLSLYPEVSVGHLEVCSCNDRFRNRCMSIHSHAKLVCLSDRPCRTIGNPEDMKLVAVVLESSFPHFHGRGSQDFRDNRRLPYCFPFVLPMELSGQYINDSHHISTHLLGERQRRFDCSQNKSTIRYCNVLV